MEAKVHEITFTDNDVVNPSDWIPAGEYNPYNVRPWLLHNHGFPLAVVFASNLQDAFDEAADAEKLEQFKLTDEEHAEWEREEREPAYLGNDCAPYDIDTVCFVELKNPAASFVAQFVESFGDKGGAQ